MNKFQMIESLYKLKSAILEVEGLFYRHEEHKIFWSKVFSKGKINLTPIDNEIKRLSEQL